MFYSGEANRECAGTSLVDIPQTDARTCFLAVSSNRKPTWTFWCGKLESEPDLLHKFRKKIIELGPCAPQVENVWKWNIGRWEALCLQRRNPELLSCQSDLELQRLSGCTIAKWLLYDSYATNSNLHWKIWTDPQSRTFVLSSLISPVLFEGFLTWLIFFHVCFDFCVRILRSLGHKFPSETFSAPDLHWGKARQWTTPNEEDFRAASRYMLGIKTNHIQWQCNSTSIW